MWIYKITNNQNGKVYIGQTIRPVQQRFRRHINDAINGTLNTHFARAIRKYGAEAFTVSIIDEAETQDELNLLEQKWIHYYDSINTGYNETDALYKCGGNTYASKTKDEMDEIKQKIRNTKLGSKNPMARKVKRINHITGEEDIFDTVIACAQACGIKNGKTSIVERLSKRTTSLYKNTYSFEYYDE